MNMKKISYLVLSISLLMVGCSRDMNDLEQYISSVKARKAGAIEPLPTIKEYQKYTYQSGLLRSPFMPDFDAEAASQAQTTGSGVRRDVNRNREFLEQYPLDSLKMVGTINSRGENFALIKTADGLIHQVKAGNYMGENDGRVMKVKESSIELREIVPDGLGQYVYRPTELPLEENI